MSSDDDASDRLRSLRKRLVGERYYDERNDESLTVIDVNPPFVMFMYDDGTMWDEMIDADTLSEAATDRFGLEQHGLDSANFRQLPPGPGRGHVCDSGEHKWSPAVEDVWPTPPAAENRPQLRDEYAEFARCKRCGLSPRVLEVFDQVADYPWFCRACGDLTPAEEVSYLTAEYPDEPVCPDCIEDAGGIKSDPLTEPRRDTDEDTT